MRVLLIGSLLLCLIIPTAVAENPAEDVRKILIKKELGIDPSVDYSSLVRFGPWDDRNYQLTAADLLLLSPTEAELADPIPAFFRIEMRRVWTSLPRTGPAQYPRSALQIYRRMFGGYEVGGRQYRKARRVDGLFELVLESELPQASDAQTEKDSADFVSGEIRVTNPTGAAESAIKVCPTDINKIVAGSNGPIDGQDMHFSTDGGASWTRVPLPLGGTCCDPSVDWSADGQYAYTTTLGNCGFFGCQLWFYRSDDGGASWNSLESLTPGDPRREVTTGSSDKEYLHVDQHASSPYKDNIYIAWHDSNVQKFAVSTDMGNTFTSQSFGGDSSERGIGSDITSDRSGHVYYFWPGTNNSTIRLRKSTNGGGTFSSTIVVANTKAAYDFPVPSMDSRRVFVYASAGSDLGSGTYGGSVYVAWSDATAPTGGNPASNHGQIQVAYSRDGGSNWNVTTPHETADAQTVDRYHPWLAVGSDGTVHVVYYDTRRDNTRTSVDLFYSYSSDGAQTWSAPSRVTTVQSPSINDSFEFGDYNGLDIVLDGLIAIFTDNRSESGGGGDSVDVYSAGIEPGTGAVCGNAEIDAGEACDGVNLGGQTCTDVGCTGGVLACAADCGDLDTSGCSGCAGSGAGRIAGSKSVSGQPMTVEKTGSDLTLSWQAACGAADDYSVYEGILGTPDSHNARKCSTGGSTKATFTPDPGSRYFLVVAASGNEEGSYGRKSDGTERSQAGDACHPSQVLDASCP